MRHRPLRLAGWTVVCLRRVCWYRPEVRLWRVVDAGFAERRKTMRNALRRLGLNVGEADGVLAGCGLAASVRAEELSLGTFAAIAERMPA